VTQPQPSAVQHPVPKRISRIDLFKAFLKIGFFGFGGVPGWKSASSHVFRPAGRMRSLLGQLAGPFLCFLWERSAAQTRPCRKCAAGWSIISIAWMMRHSPTRRRYANRAESKCHYDEHDGLAHRRTWRSNRGGSFAIFVLGLCAERILRRFSASHAIYVLKKTLAPIALGLMRDSGLDLMRSVDLGGLTMAPTGGMTLLVGLFRNKSFVRHRGGRNYRAGLHSP
jgi:hypothetical protein